MATKKKCMSCGGSMKMKSGGITQDIVGMPGYNARTDTMKKGGVAKIKTLKKAALGMNVEPTKKYVPGAGKKAADKATIMNPKNYATGGSSTAVKHGCPPGTARLASGGCGSRSLYGG